MEPLVLLMETAALAAAMCALHAARPRLGLAPFFMAISVFAVFLFVAGKGQPVVSAQYFFAEPGRLGSMLFMPLMLASMVLIYDLEGTLAARKLFGALVVVYLIHGVIDQILHWHAAHPPPGIPDLSSSVLFAYSHTARLASLGAILIDCIVIIVTYQGLRNIFPSLPRPAALFVGLLLAMFSDAIAYLTFTGDIFDSPPSFDLIEKAQTGLAAAIPTALYMAWYHRRWPDRVRNDRRTLEILALRRKLEEEQERRARQEARYKRLRSTFNRYVSPEVAELIATNPDKAALGGEEREVTILFADIRGYSTLSEIMAPTEIIDMLNEYFGKVSEQILAHGGMINEFEGDGVLAVFGAPLPQHDHAVRAYQAAQGMLQAVEGLNTAWEGTQRAKRWQEAGMDGLAIRVGLHSGRVVAGNIGSDARMKYAVIGDAVNLASRVEGLNKALGTQLLMTAATHNAITGAGHNTAVHPKGTHQVKGRGEPVEVFGTDPSED